MSVKNILDGSIQIGAGGLTPESEISVNHVYSNLGLQTPGIIDVGGSAHIAKQITTPKIITQHICLPDPNEDPSQVTSFPTVLTYNNITTPTVTATESITTPTLAAKESITTPALTVNGLNLFANDQKIYEKVSFDFIDGDGESHGVLYTLSATWLAITQNCHLFQFEVDKMSGIYTTLAGFSVTVPKILPPYTYTLHDAVSALVDNKELFCFVKIEAVQNTSLKVTITFSAPQTLPTSISVRFLRLMP